MYGFARSSTTVLLLVFLLVGCETVFRGCAILSNDTVYVGEVTVFNRMADETTGTITIRSPEGQTVLDRQFTLDAYSKPAPDSASATEDGPFSDHSLSISLGQSTQGVSTYDGVLKQPGKHIVTVSTEGESGRSVSKEQIVNITRPDKQRMAVYLDETTGDDIQIELSSPPGDRG